MGKTKRKSKEKDEDYIKKKIRKLEKKLRNLPQDNHWNSDSDNSHVVKSQSRTPPPLSSTVHTEPVAGSSNAPEILDQVLTNTESDQLPEEFLLALGNEGEDNTEVGEPIRPELALRWSKIMSDGLGKEPRNTILKKYPTPSNFPRAEAPHMNAEILASLSEPSLKRDKRIVNRQNITGKLMACLGKSLTNLLKGNINSRLLIEEINDAAKLAAEIHHQDSSSRKFFALAGANKTVQEAVRNAKTDEFLFGVDCAEKIKAAQTIKKTSSQIKTTVLKEPTKPALKKQGNWKSPSQYQNQQHQRARDGQHQHQPAFKRQFRSDQSHQRGRKRAPLRSRPRHQY